MPQAAADAGGDPAAPADDAAQGSAAADEHRPTREASTASTVDPDPVTNPCRPNCFAGGQPP